ncbi:peptidoglycan-recognition protein SC2-like [Musca vetustissima]|uniref:peptidoglycan-recognition protein SC2-like n=1 Tax=Musca vetustissima TaxID=27455 RepID=UPI002AB6202D|nr:peptidoglycan-recognition protein SC2-like [Musca vetustissima]
MKAFFALLAVLCCTSGISAINIITKSQWGGRAATSKSYLAKGLSYVVIHHSAGAYCNTQATCSAQMRNMQSYHMDSLGWADIGYNYGIGADGNIYEGRGAGVMGAHATNWNSKSYGIMFIGNYNNYTPTAAQISKAKELIAWLVSQGYVSSNYTLYGHRQVGSTECPGNNLYNEIKKWSNWRA